MVYIVKIAPFSINGGSGGELEFWCVVSKYSQGYGRPVPPIFMGVLSRESRFPDIGPSAGFCLLFNRQISRNFAKNPKKKLGQYQDYHSTMVENL